MSSRPAHSSAWGDPTSQPAGHVRARLRSETRALHDALEQRLDLLGDGLTLERYRWVLEVFHGFYQPLEARLATFAATIPTLGIVLRDRAPLLAQDLAALPTSAPGRAFDAASRRPLCVNLPEVTRLEHLAGSLYVLEGACLGGQVVSRHVAIRLGLTRTRGLRFFIGDADATAARFGEVLRWLEERVEDGADVSEMVASARAVFATLTAWTETIGESR